VSAPPRKSSPPAEPDGFDYESKLWGAAAVYPRSWYLQGLRLRWCLEDLAPIHGRVLDAGCGAGNMTKALKRERPDLELVGMDVSRRSIDQALASSEGVRFEVGNVEHPPTALGRFDAVVMFDVLEHLAHPERALDAVARVLKPGGLFHLALPLEDQPWTLHRYLRRRGWQAKVRHSGHVQAFSADSFRALAAAAGFDVARVRYSSHPLLTFADVAYYLYLDARGGASRSLDDQLAEATTPRAAVMRALKAGVAAMGWWESRLLSKLPGACGHFTMTREEPRFPPRARPPDSARRSGVGGPHSLGPAKPGPRAAKNSEERS
jgi:SAM-dependent methyltransferase